MKFIRQIERYKTLHKLIKQARTGTPDMLATRLHISRSQLYVFLDTLKDLGAPIKYNRTAQSFYYSSNFELDIDISVKAITPCECKTIYAGNCLQINSSMLFSGRGRANLLMQSNVTMQVKLTA